MKKLLSLLILVAFTSTFSSCTTENEDEPLPSVYLKAKVNGVDFYTEFIVALYENNLDSSKSLVITAGAMNTKKIGINCLNFLESQSHYVFTSNNFDFGFDYTNLITSDFYDETTQGVLDITELTSTHMKGTFSFTGINESSQIINVTDGEFSIDIY